MKIMARFVAVAALLALALAGIGCSRAPKTNVLFITVDTFRYDHLSLASRHAETPRMDALAREGVFFPRAVAHAPLTLPSHSSIFTSLNPVSHGVRNNGDFVLPADVPTLAEAFRGRGYATGAAIASFVLNSRFGLARGFDSYLDVHEHASLGERGFNPFFNEIPAEEVTRRGLSLLDNFPKGKPWLLWLHYFDAHAPHEYPPNYRGSAKHSYAAEVERIDAALGVLFDGLRARGAWENTIVVLTADHGESLGLHGEPTHGILLYDSTMRVILMMRGPGIPPAKLSAARVRGVDIAPTLFDLTGVKPFKTTEGKSFAPLFRGEPYEPEPAYMEAYAPYFQFGWSYLRAFVHDGRKYILGPKPELYHLDEDMLEERDVLGQDAARGQELRARLAGFLKEHPSRSANAVLSEEDIARLMSLGYLPSQAPAPSETEEEMGRLANPVERIGAFHDMTRATGLALSGQTREAAALLEEVLKKEPQILIARQHAAGLYRELRDWDRALAHLDELARLRPEEAWHAEYWRALRPMETGGSTEESREKLEKFLDRCLHPQLLIPCREANLFLARIHARRGDAERVKEIFSENPYFADEEISPVVHANIAETLATAGLHEEAERRLREALGREPESADLHFALGNVLRDTGRPTEAFVAFEKALSLNASHADAMVNMGNLYGQVRSYVLAAQWLERALEVRPDDARTLANLGITRHFLGETAKAEEHLKRAMALDPALVSARLMLAGIYLETERTREALALCREVLKREPHNREALAVLEKHGG